MKINLNIFKKSIRKINIKDPVTKKGFIIFQIDGLSYSAAKKAFSLHLMPHLKKMIKKEKYNFDKYFTGVPSDTPYFQAGLLYGDNNDIPGFRWIEKSTGEEIIFKNPESAGQVEESLSKDKKGLLRGGSSYVNLFAGGAYRSTFTLSTFSIRYLFKRKVRDFDIFIIFIFHIFTLLKTLVYVFFEFLLEIWEKINDVIKKKEVRPEGLFPFFRATSNVIFKEIETFGCIMDISRGVPAIYLDYIGYDELSHHRGPFSYSALRTLKAIDRKIYHINKEIKKSKKHYDFFIISDHGHTPSLPYERINKEKLKDTVLKYSDNKILYGYEFDSGYDVAVKRLITYLGDFFKKGNCMVAFNRIRGKIDTKEKAGETVRQDYADLNWGNPGIIYIMNSGPMSNIYFSGKSTKMSVEEITEEYPGLMPGLSNTNGIGFIMGLNEDGKPVIYNDKEKEFDVFEGLSKGDYDCFPVSLKNILEEYEGKLRDIALSSIRDFCLFRNSGDLILFGTYSRNYIVNFENQMGAHGGIGGDQNTPFAVWNNDSGFDFAKVDNSCKIYEFLYNNYVK